MALNLLRRFLRPNNYYTVCHRCKTKQTDVIVFDNFKRSEKKDRKTYLDMIKIYEQTETRRRGHVEFIYAAMRCMEEYGVNKDLEVYKKLLDVLPKGRFVPTNIFQAEYMHYPKQQQCAISLLDQMEDNGKVLYQNIHKK